MISKMRNFISATLLAAALIAAAAGCTARKAEPVEEAVQQLLYGPMRPAIVELHARGKESIPALIAVIDSSETTGAPFLDPASSTISNALSEFRKGVAAAYVIEMILMTEELHFAGDQDWSGPLGLNRQHYLYTGQQGVIIHSGGDSGWSGVGSSGDRGLTVEELKEVKAIYQKWWEENKKKSIEELRADWKEGRRPLSGSAYMWW